MEFCFELYHIIIQSYINTINIIDYWFNHEILLGDGPHDVAMAFPRDSVASHSAGPALVLPAPPENLRKAR